MYANQQAYGGAAIHGNSIDRVLLIDETTTTVQKANEDLAGCVAEFRGHLDALLGVEPQPAAPQPTGLGAGADGRVYGLKAQANMTHELLGQLRGELNRLRRL